MAEASYTRDMKTLSVKIPESLSNWLIEESRRTRRSRSELVREALELRILGKQNNKPKARNMVDALLSCGGTFVGPGDLSTNAKYFDDFGK